MALDKADRIVQRDALFKGLTGHDFSETVGNLSSMLGLLFSSDNEKHPIDTKLAARRLGVSQRTVQRWIRGESTPRPEMVKKLQTRTRQSVTTKRGRTQMARKLKGRLPGKSSRVTIHGLQGPTPDPEDRGYLRFGNSHLDLSPEEQEELLNQWAEGGDERALAFLQGIYATGGRYVEGWHFHGVDGFTVHGAGPGLR